MFLHTKIFSICETSLYYLICFILYSISGYRYGLCAIKTKKVYIECNLIIIIYCTLFEFFFLNEDKKNVSSSSHFHHSF